MMYWYGNGMGGWSYALMTVNMLLFWGLVVGAVVALARYLIRTDVPARGRARVPGVTVPLWSATCQIIGT